MIIILSFIVQTLSWSLNSTFLNTTLYPGIMATMAQFDTSTYLVIYGQSSLIDYSNSSSLYLVEGPNFDSPEQCLQGLPAKSSGCSASIGDTVYFYGGFDGTFYLNDLWAFNITARSWTLVLTLQSQGRTNCGMVSSDVGLYIFGGIKQAYMSTSDHYFVNVSTLQITSINVLSQYTVLENKLWNGETQNYTAEGTFPNMSSFMSSKTLWLSDTIVSSSSSLMVLVDSNTTSTTIYILDKSTLCLQHTLHLVFTVYSCQLLQAGLFCSVSNTLQQITFVFFRASDWSMSYLLPDYIQYTSWPTAISVGILLGVQNDLKLLALSAQLASLYTLPQNSCTLNNNTLSCFYSKAYCSQSFFGAYCDQPVCPQSLIFNDPQSFQNYTFQCGGNGICQEGSCLCGTNYSGPTCDVYVGAVCAGIYEENYPMSTCTCTTNTTGGNDCKTLFCYNDCVGVGNCQQGLCNCAFPYSGPDCSIIQVNINFAWGQWKVAIVISLLIAFIL